VHQEGTPCTPYVRSDILTALKCKGNCNGQGKETIKTKGFKLLLDVFQFTGISCYDVADGDDDARMDRNFIQSWAFMLVVLNL
jgi:hypothetical protein